jgi:hypothetical protein
MWPAPLDDPCERLRGAGGVLPQQPLHLRARRLEGFAPGSNNTAFKFKKTIATPVECTTTTTCTMLAPAATKAGTVDVRATVGKKTSKPNRPADQFTYS